MAIANNPVPLGKITTTAGTELRLTNNFLANTDYTEMLASKIEIQALPTNTGNVYVGYSGMNTTTMVGVIHILPAGETWTIGDQTSLNVFKPQDLYVDVSVTGEGAIAAAHVR